MTRISLPRSSRRVPSGRSREAGFTLVEVLSALVILAIAMTAAYATFQFQHASFTVQNRVGEAQQNLRAAIEVLSRDIRLAGYGIPAGTQIKLPDGLLPSGDNTIRTLSPRNRTTAADNLCLIYRYDMDAGMPPTTLANGMGAYTDVMNVASAGGYAQGDLVMVTNDLAEDLFEVTSVAAPTLNHSVGGSANQYNSVGAHSLWPGGGYAAGSTVSKVRFVCYFVDDVTDPAHPTLMLDRMNGAAAQPLADDIEDLQVEYGLDTNGDFVIDSWTPSPSFAQLSQVKQVGLFLSARTRMPERGWQGFRPALSDRAAGPADGYRRRTLDNVAIDLRNPG